MFRVGVLAVLAGCQVAFGIHHVGKDVDAAVDAPPCQSFSRLLDTCALPSPDTWAPVLAIGSASDYSTTNHLLDNVTPAYTIVTNASGSIDVLLAHSVMVGSGASLRLEGIQGGNSVAIVSDGAIEIDGSIGAAGARGAAKCVASEGGFAMPNAAGGGGGGGAGFGGRGGNGSTGNNGGVPSGAGSGGDAVPLPVGLVGGCHGGPGGAGDTAMGGAAGLGGQGGGAVALIAETGITIAVGATIAAGGGGGGGGKGSGGGGGGGGAGGMIWLEADTLTVSGTLAANGGGGGEGAAATSGNDGMTGAPSATPAQGGSGAAFNGGDGGSGGALANPDGAPATDLRTAGGGGGGGGAGFIVLIARTMLEKTGIVSPAPVMP